MLRLKLRGRSATLKKDLQLPDKGRTLQGEVFPFSSLFWGVGVGQKSPPSPESPLSHTEVLLNYKKMPFLRDATPTRK